MSKRQLISVVVPLYNEAAGVAAFHESLRAVLTQSPSTLEFEIIYCNDGSTDGTLEKLAEIAEADKIVRVLSLTRNFGKEIAVTAGMHAARGDAVLTLDGDGQYPVELIPQFVRRWQGGSKVVIGVRISNENEGFIKRYGPKLFYWFFSRVAGVRGTLETTDFRIIDKSVLVEFSRLTERNRVTRGLINWMGYPCDYIEFKARARAVGEAGYSVRKLFKLALDIVVSSSMSPLYIAAYIGAIVLPLSTLAGLGMLINWATGDPLSLHATASAYVIMFMLFLIGVLLVSQGIIGLYLSHIHSETQNRPLYIIDTEHSRRINDR